MPYTPLLFARVGETEVTGNRTLPVEWVVIGRWDLDSGIVQFGLEFLDERQGDVGDDLVFDSIAAAQQHAETEFGLGPAAWTDRLP